MHIQGNIKEIYPNLYNKAQSMGEEDAKALLFCFCILQANIAPNICVCPACMPNLPEFIYELLPLLNAAFEDALVADSEHIRNLRKRKLEEN